MTKIVEEAFAAISGYFISMSVDTVTGLYVLEIGIPANWAFSDNMNIKCELIAESDEGKLLKIISCNENVGIDDLIEFVSLIIDTNVKIAKKEEEFNEKMNSMKKQFEEEAKKFYEELDYLKDISFKKIAENMNLNPNDSVKKRAYNRKQNNVITPITGTTGI